MYENRRGNPERRKVYDLSYFNSGGDERRKTSYRGRRTEDFLAAKLKNQDSWRKRFEPDKK